MKLWYLMEENSGMGSDVRLEPAWKKLVSSSYRKGCVQHCSIGVMKKKQNPLGLGRQILLCNSCGSYWHPLVEYLDSWKNMIKRKASQGNMTSVDQSNN